MLYLWVKALHIIFVVALIASLLVYPRYKIHQLSSSPGEPLYEAMKKSSAQLRLIIMNPSLILVWVFGLTMLWMNPALLSQGWLHAKLALVLILSGMHGYFIRLGKKVDSGGDGVSARQLRMLNEVPFLLMVVIVILVVAKPF
ncbi:CopD family protein [Hyphomonas sp.]|uniref:CopD family protein n=1 Tax=Hyphomonas sp. TaxID=87 RepID=UPI003563842F